jgi:hypothetical protein
MGNDKPRREHLLLDLHLDRLDEEGRQQLEGELRRDPELRAQSDRLGKMLRPLDYWTVPAAPSNLSDRILTHVRSASQEEQPVLAFPEGGADAGSSRHRGGPSWRDFAAVAACILMVFTWLVPGLSSSRARAHRLQCQENLRAVHQGTAIYQATFGGALPFAGRQNGAAWLPVASGSGQRKATPEYRSNSRHVFLLLRSSTGPKPQNFVCPADADGTPLEVDSFSDMTDFARKSNISYDTLNMAGVLPKRGSRPATAFMADPNPLFVSGRFDSTVDARHANSRAHGGEGQNVLMLDGSVQWLNSPVYGPRQDNLWLVDDLLRYSGFEAQQRPEDAFLIPGFPSTDPELATMSVN